MAQLFPSIIFLNGEALNTTEAHLFVDEFVRDLICLWMNGIAQHKSAGN